MYRFAQSDLIKRLPLYLSQNQGYSICFTWIALSQTCYLDSPYNKTLVDVCLLMFPWRWSNSLPLTWMFFKNIWTKKMNSRKKFGFFCLFLVKKLSKNRKNWLVTKGDRWRHKWWQLTSRNYFSSVFQMQYYVKGSIL